MSPREAGTAPRLWEPPQEFDEYRLIQLIGRGRHGRVYLAQDTLLDRAVAVKFIPAQDSVWLNRFLLEARAAARVQHPNVVTLYRVGQVDQQAYLVSEFIRGQSLDRIPKPVEWRRVLEIALDLARGLSAAHRCGVLHRDIKPGNAVVAESGEVKLLDFGLAKLTDASTGALPPEAAPGQQLAENLVGTPYFIAPEIWRNEEATARSDLYSLGILLYELCAGKGPFRDVKPSELPERVQAQAPRPLSDVVPGIDGRLAALIDRCIRADPGKRLSSADLLIDELELLRPRAQASVPDGNPYRGLQAFEPEQKSLFFGRRREVRGAIERLRTEPFLLLTGDSGVGKSSLCQAGILPAVLEGALLEGRGWNCVRLVPGRRPLSALAATLSRYLGKAELEFEELLRKQPAEMARALRSRLGASEGLLVYVDQLEELVTLSVQHQAEAAAFALSQLALGYGGLRLLASARSDFLSRLARLPGLGEQVPQALYLVRGLNAEETREAIVGPALIKGVRFESEELVDQLVASGKAAEGGLPILQFALAELWARREQNVVTAKALEAMGGVEGALARHADGVVERLLPAQRALARELLLRLVTLDGTRARRTREELRCDQPERAAALEALVQGRLLVAREGDEGSTIELAHEALISSWGTLARWLAEAAESRARREQLEGAARAWEQSRRSPDRLWRGKPLEEARRLEGSLSQLETEFVAASRKAERRSRVLRRSLAVGFFVSLAVVWLAFRLVNRAQKADAVRAQLERAEALFDEARVADRALQQAQARAFEDFDARQRPRAEADWTKAEALRKSAEHGFDQAGTAFEQALALGPEEAETGQRLADFLFARAEFEDRIGQTAVRDVLLGRLALFDHGERLAQWKAPATLDVSASQPVTLELVRYGPAPDRAASLPRGLGQAPVSGLTLPAGSYLLVASAPGRAEVRYPLLLGRGEHRTLTLHLPEASRIPRGFVYVPEGRFLFGTAADEEVREFFNTAPLHPVHTGPFLISRTETTYADWIAFLEALSPKERLEHRPHVGGSGFTGQLDLSQRRGHWVLTIELGHRRQSLAEGEKLRYPTRPGAPGYDWRELPVAGISYDDSLAYARWLSKSGKVPGARLCTELEWERAGRGADGRLYPGSDRIDRGDANFDLTYGKSPKGFGPDPVGSFPQSRSPFGIDDLSGNVWEWVDSSLADGEVVARGGSYYSNASSCRLENRQSPERNFRDLIVGLRICADASGL